MEHWGRAPFCNAGSGMGMDKKLVQVPIPIEIDEGWLLYFPRCRDYL